MVGRAKYCGWLVQPRSPPCLWLRFGKTENDIYPWQLGFRMQISFLRLNALEWDLWSENEFESISCPFWHFPNKQGHGNLKIFCLLNCPFSCCFCFDRSRVRGSMALALWDRILGPCTAATLSSSGCPSGIGPLGISALDCGSHFWCLNYNLSFQSSLT